MTGLPYRTLSSFLHVRFRRRIRKISLDAGLTCPNRAPDKRGGCIYCSAAGSGTGALSRGMGLKGQIESQMKIMAERYHAQGYIAYFQSFTNTYGPVDKLKAIYDAILPYPEIVGLSIGTRPDCIDREKLELISSYAPGREVWLEYGLQSADDRTLKLINRGHDVKSFIDAVELTADYPLRRCAHVILGLPGEGADHYRRTARLVSSLPVTDIKIHLLYVIRGTPLEAMLGEGKYEPLTLEGYARATADFIAHLREDIVIQRITGDPHPPELVGPKWALEKGKVRTAVHQALAEQGITQGCRTGMP
jgi:radical SAM protein (TIGR01212 family)